MASTEHSPILGLSLWSPSDRPERLDFLGDNQKLEQLVGGHIGNAQLHMSPEERTFLSAPFKVDIVTGNGNMEQRGRPLIDWPNLKAVFMIQPGKPPYLTDSSGVNHIYWDFWVSTGGTNYATDYVGNGALYYYQGFLSRQTRRVQGTYDYYHLNDSGQRYIMIYLPKT